jgi:type VI secretion system protein ImpG
MPDDLLSYYNRELAGIRRLAAEFARAHPGIAESLRISTDRIDDPHVSRLIEAFAYLNARTRQKLDDDFPEITEAFLGTLYPHYLAPFPPAAIAKFQLDRGQTELTSGYQIERGARVLTETVDGEPCRFRTCFPVTLYPMEVAEAGFHGLVEPAPPSRFTDPVKGFARIRLKSFSDSIPLGQFQLGTLRFYLSGHAPFMHKLYEFLLNQTLGVAVARSASDRQAVFLPADCLQPVGFGSEEALIDYTSRSFPGYRLLSEYFVLPEKFLFVDLHGLTPGLLARLGDQPQLELYFYFNRESRDLEHNVSAETFRLGCSPIVNLFSKNAEPVRLSHRQSEYRIVPDERRPLHFEVHSVQRVTAVSSDGEEQEFLPFYSVRHEQQFTGSSSGRFWYAARRPSIHSGGADAGTELFITLVDLNFQPIEIDDWTTLLIETTCLNRDLPARFDFGGGQPRLHLESGGPLEQVQCLTAPTPAHRPDLGHAARWKLISHLSLGHLSLIDTADGAEPLREILRLYNPANLVESTSVIDGLRKVRSQRVVGRVGGSVSAGFCRGIEVTLEFDEDKYVGRGLYLFASLLERFLPLYASINSFTKTIAISNRREKPLKVWPPRVGEKSLL